MAPVTLLFKNSQEHMLGTPIWGSYRRGYCLLASRGCFAGRPCICRRDTSNRLGRPYTRTRGGWPQSVERCEMAEEARARV